MSDQKNLKFRNLTIRQFDELINTNQQLNELYKHINDIRALNEKLHQHLSPSLSNHFNVTNYSDETLTVSADTSAWASKLRYCIPDILNFAQLECGLTKLKTVRVNVLPIYDKIKITQHKNSNSIRKVSLSKKSADFIEDIAKKIDDPILQKSILRISFHGK